QDARPELAGQAVQVYGDVDFQLPDQLGHSQVSHGLDVDEAVGAAFDAVADGAAVVQSDRQGDDFEPLLVVMLQRRDDGGAHGVGTKIRGNIGDANFLVTVCFASPKRSCSQLDAPCHRLRQ